MRARLERTVARAAKSGALWIEGPAGTGKTTLLAAWLHRTRRPALWVRLEGAEADASLLIQRLRGGVAARAGGGRAPLPELLPGVDIGEFAGRFFRALFEVLAPKTALVIDDAHVVGPETRLFRVLVAAVDVPRVDHPILFASRTPPPDVFARLRIEKRLFVLDPHELFLLPREAAAFVETHATVLNAAKRKSEVAKLVAECDGWFAALVLRLAQAAWELEPPSAGEAREVLFAYLAREVLAGLDARTRHVLEAAALLSDASSREVGELTRVGEEPGIDADACERILERLRRRALFVDRHGEGAYRLHPLLRAVLLSELETSAPPASLRALHERAVTLLVERGAPELAFDFVRKLGDLDRTRAFIEAAAPSLWARSAWETLRRFFQDCPERGDDSPNLTVWRAMSSLVSDVAGAIRLFKVAFEAASAEGEERCRARAFCGWIQAVLHEGRSFELLDQALARFRETAWDKGGLPIALECEVAAFGLLLFAYRGGDEEDLTRFVTVARRALLSEVGPAQKLMVGTALVAHYVFEGDVSAALGVHGLVRSLSEGHDAQASAIAFDLASSRLLMLRGDAAGARACVERGVARLALTGLTFWKVSLLFTSVVVDIGERRLAEAERTLLELEVLAGNGRPLDAGNFSYAAALAAYRAGDLSRARAFAPLALTTARSLGYRLAIGLSLVLLAELEITEHRYEEARARLAEARAEPHVPKLLRVLLDLVEARLELAGGDRAVARAFLERAFEAMRAGGVLSLLFVLPDEELADLAAEALRCGIQIEHVTAVVRVRALRPTTPPTDVSGWPWPLRIRVLGGLELEPGLTLGPKSPRIPLSVLGLLCALSTPERPMVPARALEDALWPDAEGDRASHSLEMALHRLRKLLAADDVIIVRAEQIGLSRASVFVDVWRLRELLTKPATEARATELASLYVGPLLPAMDFAVVARERTRLRRMLSTTIDELASTSVVLSRRLSLELCGRDPALESFLVKTTSTRSL
ncbi:MAG: hypothetical protein U0271_01440 [Polyangiaceae bacterium]